MTTTWFFIVLEFSAIACGLVSGVFLTFSDFVMRSLNGAKPAAGIEVMQVINREVYSSVFIALLLGMSALSPLLAGYAYLYIAGPTASLIMAGSAIYLTGVLGVTLACNVPMNTRLDAMELASPQAATYWTGTYFPRWTMWNHIRTFASAASAICFLVACVWLAQGA